jgi:hypothetical protein
VVTLCNTEALGRVPARAVAAAAGIIASVQSLGGIVTNPLVGFTVQHAGYGPALLALAGWTIPCAILWMAMRDGAPTSSAGEPPSAESPQTRPSRAKAG